MTSNPLLDKIEKDIVQTTKDLQQMSAELNQAIQIRQRLETSLLIARGKLGALQEVKAEIVGKPKTVIERKVNPNKPSK